jgi:hypothetical protein
MEPPPPVKPSEKPIIRPKSRLRNILLSLAPETGPKQAKFLLINDAQK